MPEPRRGNRRLVVVRAGDNSLHPGWLAGPAAPSFDLAISYYGDGDPPLPPRALLHRSKGGKWEGLFDFFARYPHLLDDYDYCWMPDDDLAADAGAINRLFDVAAARGLAAAQPSLSWQSHVSHFITLNNPRFELRYTNIVEVMAPLLATDLLRLVLPLFEGRRFGWGLDYLWPRWLPDGRWRSGIVDAVAVEHTRPVGSGGLYGGDFGPAVEEAIALRRSLGVRRPRIVVYGAVDRRGRHLARGPRLAAALYAGWRPLRAFNSTMGPFAVPRRHLAWRVLKMVREEPDLSPLPPPRRAGAPA